MPVEKTSSQQKIEQNGSKRARLKLSTKASDQKSSSNSKKRRIAIASVVVLVVGGFVWWTFGGGSTLGVQNSLESYLKNKYDKDFIVGRPRLQGTGLAITGSYRAEAYPKDDSTLKFEVGKVQKEEKFFDDYTGTVWAKEEHPKVEALLETLYPSSTPDFDLRTHITTSQEPDPIRGTIPSIDSAIKQYSSRFYYDLTVRFLVSALSESNKEDYKTKFKTIESYVNNRGADLYSLRFAVNIKDSEGSYICDAGHYATASTETTLETCLDKKQNGKAW